MKKLRFKQVDMELGFDLPQYATPGSAGLDLTARSKKANEKYIEYGTNTAVEIPEGYVGLLFMRSSVTKKDVQLKNAVGVIDSDYRGEISFRFQYTTDIAITSMEIIGNALGGHMDNLPENDILSELTARTEAAKPEEYEVGDKIGQLVIVPAPQFEVEKAKFLTDTQRGTGGYGSTGK